MRSPSEAAHIPEDAEAASEALHWQMASARAAVAKHHARLVDQLEADGPDRTEADPPFR